VLHRHELLGELVELPDAGELLERRRLAHLPGGALLVSAERGGGCARLETGSSNIENWSSTSPSLRRSPCTRRARRFFFPLMRISLVLSTSSRLKSAPVEEDLHVRLGERGSGLGDGDVVAEPAADGRYRLVDGEGARRPLERKPFERRHPGGTLLETAFAWGRPDRACMLERLPGAEAARSGAWRKRRQERVGRQKR